MMDFLEQLKEVLALFFAYSDMKLFNVLFITFIIFILSDIITRISYNRLNKRYEILKKKYEDLINEPSTLEETTSE